MTSKQIFTFIIFLIVLVAVAVLISQFGGEQNRQAEVPIEAEFPGKIVYATSLEGFDVEDLRMDCRARGGQFNECGSICAPDAEVCADVCAYTCDISEDSFEELNWERYENDDVGFAISHPFEMEVREVDGGPEAIGDAVNFVIIGSTQTELGTEFYDGVSMTIGQVEKPEEITLQEFVESKMDEPHVNPLDSHPTRTTMSDNREAWTFRAMGEIEMESTYVYVTGSGSAVYEIVYVAPDPTGRGFEEIAENMLSTFKIL